MPFDLWLVPNWSLSLGKPSQLNNMKFELHPMEPKFLKPQKIKRS